ncbi:hypothetical protein NL676_030149 [Syzygium grande]|nr:hypothetical protein NL676_030149 [Syzygium grande]
MPNYAQHCLSWKRASEQKERELLPRQRSNTKLQKSANARRNPQPPNSLEPYKPGRTPGDVELEAEKTRKRRDQRAFGGEVTGAEVEGHRHIPVSLVYPAEALSRDFDLTSTDNVASSADMA